MACEVARRVLDVRVQEWDVDGRRNAVEAVLHYRDGTRAAFEVSKLAAPGAIQLESLLRSQDFVWPAPGEWGWSVGLSDPRHLPRLRECFASVAVWCEANGVTRPQDLWNRHGVPADVWWVSQQEGITLSGNPGGPLQLANGRRVVMVTPGPSGGMVDEALTGLNDALAGAFVDTHLARKVEKLNAHPGVEERHLYVIVHSTGLPFAISYGLSFGERLTEEPPPLPDGLTHVWLAPQYGERVLLGTAHGWTQHRPYGRP
jgi:hypothetical protein